MVTMEFSAEEMTVSIDRDMEELVPDYIESRRKDVTAIPEALSRGDFKSVRVTGHNMAGTGSAYGFQAITTIGRKMEAAALAGDKNVIEECVSALAFFVENVEIKYV
jgi:hypothetical protein